MKFDPMTGKPINDEAEETMQFDPMTGEPIGVKAEETMQFDPMTGEPIGVKAEETMQFDPMTGKPIKAKNGKKSKAPKIIGVICAAVVVVAVIAAVLIKLLMPNSVKVCIATANTFKDMPYIVEDIKPLGGILSSDKVTLGVTGSFSDNDVTAEILTTGKETQAVLNLDGEDISDFKVIADIDKEAVRLSAPALDSKVYAYYFNKSNDGYIVDLLDDDIDEINDLLKSFHNQEDVMRSFRKDMTDAIVSELKKAEFKKIDSEYYEVDGKDVKCKGYQLKIDDKLAESVLKSMKAASKEYSQWLSELTGSKTDIEDMFDELIEEAEDMESIKASIYIRGNKLAAIVLEIEDDELEIEFKGGDYRTQNITVTLEESNGKEYTLKMKGSVSDNTEKLKFSADGSELCTIKYNYKSGEFEFELSPGFELAGELKSSSSEVVCTIDTVCFSGVKYASESNNLSIYAKKGAKLLSLKGKEFDLGNADKEDLQDAIEDLQDAIEDADLDDFVKALRYIF